MSDERNSRFLARLITVGARRVDQPFFKFLGQFHDRLWRDPGKKIFRFPEPSAPIERRYRTSLRVRLVEPVFVPVFERKVPI